jgi:hypothetical protein
MARAGDFAVGDWVRFVPGCRQRYVLKGRSAEEAVCAEGLLGRVVSWTPEDHYEVAALFPEEATSHPADRWSYVEAESFERAAPTEEELDAWLLHEISR